MDWTKELQTAFLVRRHLAGVDPNWPLRNPNPPANEAEIRAAMSVVGPLDLRYERFLLAANGWESMYQMVDLMGTRDLVGSPRMQRAHQLMRSVGLDAISISESYRSQLLPIAVSAEDLDLFLLGPPSKYGAKVYWWAGELIEVFPNFDECFLSLVDHNRAQIQERAN